jgi:sugar porter (SP) family MFS transporter
MSKTYNWGFLLRISLATAMGGYLFGFDFAVITGGLPFLRDHFGLNDYWEGFTTGSLALGCIIGCMIAGGISDRYGRKPGLMASAMIFFISSLSMGLSPNLYLFIGSRFIAGIGVGMASMLSPMYLAEVSPPEIRGRLVALNQLTIVLGQVITHCENYLLRDIHHEAWRWMFGMGMVPSSLFLIGVSFIPESPRWLISVGQDDESKRILNKIGNSAYVNATMDGIRNIIHPENKAGSGNIFARAVLPAVIVGIGLAVFQQFCGINVVFNYTTNIFKSIGASSSEQLIQAVYISLANLVFTLLAMTLVDKWGRRPLMLAGAGGLALIYVIIGFLLMNRNVGGLSLFIMIAIALYAVSLAPLTWVLISEIFPFSIRRVAMSVAVICLWGAYFILVFTFPVIEREFGDIKAFWGYAVICVLGFLFIYFRLPETKGISLESMDTAFMKTDEGG